MHSPPLQARQKCCLHCRPTRCDSHSMRTTSDVSSAISRNCQRPGMQDCSECNGSPDVDEAAKWRYSIYRKHTQMREGLHRNDEHIIGHRELPPCDVSPPEGLHILAGRHSLHRVYVNALRFIVLALHQPESTVSAQRAGQTMQLSRQIDSKCRLYNHPC